ncbi:UDP-N-acetylmuramoyl-L-alanine--D-glutamate ligase [Candidatus Profftia tarda]|uniref:UDP-N-acetylmuramoylalanine--D-glutamate ligase n=1 Tax=Candidatus Profftia tarda TaxID=1177216 RepID=A0A8E4EY20_9ENTR|nr:UDP-N-acetylmuramoyl-L-alanine--D-glutamate ligase [Candidatus Profftia tarda]CAD6508562.1 UDP-N-acetylmuramoylalanine--D-glutamate ligase [Candidatus Profftia tarda]
MIDYKGKKIVIIGLGLTGLSCIDFFRSLGVTPRIIDTRVSWSGLCKLPKNIECHLGSMNQDWLLNADLIVVSPSIAVSSPELIEAAKKGVEIIGDIELFCRESQTPIVAITGSSGKSTVTTMVSRMAEYAGWNVGTGGNIGTPALTLLQQEHDIYVLELSSFQLETTNSLHATAATILNVSADHMDRYPLGLGQYRAAKLRIYENAKVCIVNSDDELTRPISNNNYRNISFGSKAGDYHLNVQRDGIWLHVRGKNILNTNDTAIIGKHNFTNALAALALSETVGIPLSASVQALINFTSLSHRLELVFDNHGVRWINDSKATNLGGTIAALNSFHVNGVLHLLLGGDSKSADFSSLTHYLQGKNIHLYCFGRDGKQLAALRPEISEYTITMEKGMIMIASRVKMGDMVLLSPGCSSLDQFKNFEHRGNEFIRLAKELG